MPNTLSEKALREPFRVGLMAGALVLPTLWVLSQDALNLVTRRPFLGSEGVTSLFALGFLPGMILGAGAVRAWAFWRSGKGNARILLLGHSALVILLGLIFPPAPTTNEALLVALATNYGVAGRDVSLYFVFNFPLQCALLMLLAGIFLRAPRA